MQENIKESQINHILHRKNKGHQSPELLYYIIISQEAWTMDVGHGYDTDANT